MAALPGGAGDGKGETNTPPNRYFLKGWRLSNRQQDAEAP
jgi:hypothetical protein